MNLIKKKTQPPGYYNWEETSAKLAKKTPEHQLHPIRPHHNLGRPQPTRLETTAISLGRRAQTNHRYHRPASCHYFLGGQRGNFFLCHQDLNPGWCLHQLGSLPLQECWHEPQIYAWWVQIKIVYQAYCMPITELMYYNAGYMLNAGKQSWVAWKW